MAWEIAQTQIAQGQSQKRIRVAVCLPHTGEWSAEWSDRVYGPLKFIADPRFDKVIFPARGIPIDVTRNLLVKNALADPLVTHVFFIDSDVVPEMNPNDAIWMLLQTNAPIASGIYRARQKHGFNFSMWVKGEGGFIPIADWTKGTNWLKVDVIGMGLCLIRRDVWEKVPFPWFKWGSEKDIATPSEDFTACLKFAQYGFEVRVFTEVRASHISGSVKILSDGSVTTLDV